MLKEALTSLTRSQLSLILSQTTENQLLISSLEKAHFSVLALHDGIYLELTGDSAQNQK